MIKFFLCYLSFFLPISGKSAEILLYYHPKCPYCLYVLHYLDSVQKIVPMVDLQAYPQERATLKKLGGKTQIPCLFVDKIPIYESHVIVDWLKNHPDALCSK